MDLWRRRTPAPLAAAERVRQVLAARPTGWVPPPVDEGEPRAAHGSGSTVDDGAEEPGDPAVDGRAEDGGDPGGHDRLAGDTATVPDPAAGAPAASTTPTRHGVGAHGQAAAAVGLLARLRGGRLDPGRRAVAGLAVLALLVCLLAGALVLRSRPRLVVPPTVEQSGVPVPGARVGTQPGTSSASPGAAPAGTASPRATAAAARVVVAVAGAVRRPGLVSLPTGSRVDDAVRAAGGLAPGGRLGLLNLARRLVDGEQVLVGVTAPDPAPGAGGAASAAADDAAGSAAPVDLNTATAAQLDALPGIGPVLAQRIVDHRTQDGPFRSVEDLRQVSGIGAAKFASLRSSVTV